MGDSGYSINHSKEVAYTNFVFVMSDVIANNKEYPFKEGLVEISEEVYNIIKDPNYILSTEADEIILDMMKDPEYSMVAKCFRYYYTNCIKTDKKCIQTWKIIKNHITKKYSNEKEIMDHIGSIDIVIDVINGNKDEIDNQDIVILLCISQILSGPIKYLWNDAYTYTMDRLID